ncbi:MAG TPA: ComEC/Rec2 family competence protein, partial [Bacteroidota bacterium]|nr:ComEC/Rec2 family competence protein [Bacteroidota bacterium]
MLLCVSLHRKCPGLLRSLCACALLVASGALRFSQASSPAAGPACPGAEARVWGRVIECEAGAGGKCTFTLEADSGRTGGGRVPAGMRIAVTLRGNSVARARTGMRVRVEGRLASPPREGNPGEISPAGRWLSRGVSALMTVREVTVLRAPGRWSPAALIARAREAIVRESELAIPGVRGELLADLLIGERSGIPRAIRREMIDAGVAHILAVSGYRVFVLRAMILFFLSLTGMGRRGQCLLGGPLLLFYTLIAGGGASVVRATVMALAFQIGPLTGRKIGKGNALGLAALLLLVADPRELFDAGFQLSFAAVLTVQRYAGVMSACLAHVRAGGMPGTLLRGAARGALISAAATLGTLPPAAAAFGRVSVVGVFANIVIVPATGL